MMPTGSRQRPRAAHARGAAGLGDLIRLALKRDRVFLPAWLGCLVFAVLITGSSYKDLYSTPASRREVVEGLGSTPATLALYGRIYSDSLGGLVAWRLLGIAAALAGLMSILIVVRHTRADEESGRAELVGAGVVDRRAPLTAALLVAGAANAVLGALVALALIAIGLGAAGSLAVGVAFAAAGAMFAAVAAVTVQVAVFARSATALAGSVLGAAYLIRAIGDAGPHWLSWLSPLGWAQQLHPFAGERWWVLILVVALIVPLLAIAYAILERRDLGAGIVAPTPGPAHGAIATPLQLAWRLQRGPLAGWAAGFAILGLALGSIANDIGDVIGDSRSVRDAIAELGGSKDLSDAYLATAMTVFGLIAALYCVQAMLRLRAEETDGHAETLLATAVTRTRWIVSHAAIAVAGTVLILAAAGLPAGLIHAAQTSDAGQIGRVLAAALVQAPAAWVIAGIALALFGLIPRASAVAWGAVALCVLLGEIGPVADFGDWLLDISPFTHVPRLPGGAFSAAPLTLTAIAAAIAAAGLAGFRRRDVG
jgi:ABC-2 type transport system permease protein